MTTPSAMAAARLYQGHREPIQSTACLLCRKAPLPSDIDRFRRLFAETGICGVCHDALDAWSGGQEAELHDASDIGADDDSPAPGSARAA
jgi:hypothetical protein